MLKKEVLTEHGALLVSLAAEAAENMEELLDQLLDVSAIEDADISIKVEPVNLSQLLEKTVRETQILAVDKEQRLDLSLCVDEVWVEADALRIKEVIQNLLSNAIKYSSMKGKIEVCLSSNHKKARIEVIDEAGGIPKAEQHLLFKAFSQISTKPSAGERSTGLGLSICKRIMKLHQGDIKYRENSVLGSVFETTLPCIEQKK